MRIAAGNPLVSIARKAGQSCNRIAETGIPTRRNSRGPVARPGHVHARFSPAFRRAAAAKRRIDGVELPLR